MVVAHATTMHVTLLQELIWLAPTFVEALIVAIILNRRLWRILPWFLSYLVFCVLRTAFLFLQRHDVTIYFFAYWWSEPIANIVQLCVIKELFDKVFALHADSKQLANTFFQWSLALLLVLAVIIAWNSPGGDAKKLMAGVYVVKRTVAFVEAGLLVLLAIFMSTMGLPLHNYYIGIFIGLSIYGLVDLVAIAVRAKYGSINTSTVNWITMIGDTFRVVTWAAYILPEPEPPPSLTDEQLREISSSLNEMRTFVAIWRR